MRLSKSDIRLDIGLTLSYIQFIKVPLKVNRLSNWTCGEMSPEENLFGKDREARAAKSKWDELYECRTGKGQT